MTPDQLTATARLLATLRVVHKESVHLEWSRKRLFDETIDKKWVEMLEQRPELAERLEAFVSRYARMQDTIAQKLLPRWLLALAEEPGSQIEVLNRAERLGVLEDTDRWLEARQLRNRLVHEYMDDSSAFADNINLAESYSGMLIDTYHRLRKDIIDRLDIAESNLP
ncbi:hypothetical protein [Ectothiorhodospira mobilis]|uniref:hypothetical protein n=1 Tax=Ectothiorhodospira mobilis TaxID=195064 RepID=UPI001907EE59|nr:hypothetical protein [Ectothiorhodospira mobilis]MBK1692964.1 hypothetical protein [Ectothiorhodospira mobilis]